MTPEEIVIADFLDARQGAYFVIVKCGQFLVEASDYSSTWHCSESEAMKVWDRSKASALAEKQEADVQIRRAFS